jgi:hypothetical protein
MILQTEYNVCLLGDDSDGVPPFPQYHFVREGNGEGGWARGSSQFSPQAHTHM